MMEMQSNISDDTENDLPISPNSASLRIRNGGTSDIHRRHLPSSAIAAASATNPHLDITVRTDSKYSKHENQRRRLATNGRRNRFVLFIVLPVVSCVAGFIWIVSLDTSSSKHLRHEELDAERSTKSKLPTTTKQHAKVGKVYDSNSVEKQQGRVKHVHKAIPKLRDEKAEVENHAQQSNADNATKSPKKVPAYKVGTTFWKTFAEDDGSKKSYLGTIDSYDSRDELYLIVYKEDGDAEELSPEEVSRWISQGKSEDETAGDDDDDEKQQQEEDESKDESKLNTQNSINDSLKSASDHVEKGVSDKIQQTHHTIQLQGWNNPIPFRTFPLAKSVMRPIKNIDPDYGEIAYESVRNNKQFARFISSGDGASLGSFDPNSLHETSLQKRKRKGNKRHPFSRTEKFDAKAEGVQSSDLKIFYDDDRVRITTHDENEEDDDKSQEDDESAGENESQVGACRAMEWEYGYFPTCNEFHAIDVSRPYDDPNEVDKPRATNTMMKINYINHGHYRDVFIVEDNPWIWPKEYKSEHLNRPNVSFGVLHEDKVADRITKAYRSAVLKTFNWERQLDDEHREMVNIEAVVMERLRSSPRIMDIYGHCGYSITAEVVPIEFEEVVVHGEGYATRKEVEKRNRNGIRPYNNFTAEEKLGFALTMAESLADLHGFADGVIVHDDVQLCQWLRLPDGTMKLGDFNRATIMEYDVVNEKYCKFYNGGAFGNYRAPEEFDEKNLDEKIDVFSFGNNIYAMLTGLWGFYDIEDDQTTQDELIDGKLPYIDPRWKERSYIERRLVELMEKCWIYDPDERIDIFYAVEFLKETVREHNNLTNRQ